MTEGKTNENTLLLRGIFIAGELDLTGQTVNEVFAVKDAHERTLLMLGRLGELVGADRESDAITIGSVTVAVENLP